MWPVQTLTLLLWLTNEEQLFAQEVVKDPQLPAVEAPAGEQSPIDPERDLELEVG